MPNPIQEAARGVFKGVAPDGDGWNGGPPELSFDFSSAKGVIRSQTPVKGGATRLEGALRFGEGMYGGGIYCDSYLLTRFTKAYPGSGPMAILAKEFLQAAKKKESAIKADITKWFKGQPYKPLSDLVGWKEASDWENPKLVKITGVSFDKKPQLKRGPQTNFYLPATVEFILDAVKKPDVKVGPFTGMDDRELNRWVERYEHEAPENFWMDGELGLSRPKAYAMYRKRWRAMRPREQKDMMDSLDRGGRMASRVASRYVRRATDSREYGLLTKAARAGVVQALSKTIPGVYSYDGHRKQGWPEYMHQLLADRGHYSYELSSSDGSWPLEPFVARWNKSSKQFTVSSFGVKLKLKTEKAMLKFMADANKVSALIRKGLKTRDPGEAAFMMGKLTPDGVVNRALAVSHEYETVDEWHTTSITVELMLRTAKKVPAKLVEKWVKDHWRDVQATAKKVKTPPPAPDYRSQGYRDWDERGDGDEDSDMYIDTHETPSPGLGWETVKSVSPSEFEDFRFVQKDRRGFVYIHVSHR